MACTTAPAPIWEILPQLPKSPGESSLIWWLILTSVQAWIRPKARGQAVPQMALKGYVYIENMKGQSLEILCQQYSQRPLSKQCLCFHRKMLDSKVTLWLKPDLDSRDFSGRGHTGGRQSPAIYSERDSEAVSAGIKMTGRNQAHLCPQGAPVRKQLQYPAYHWGKRELNTLKLLRGGEPSSKFEYLCCSETLQLA